MSGKRAVTRTVLASGFVLLAGLLIAPRLSLRHVLVASALWYVALAALLWSVYRVLSPWLGRGGALLLMGVVTVLPIVLTVIRPAPALAVRLPCARNWGWSPAWFLRSSPLGSLRFTVGGVRVTLCYGRPAARGRRMLGGSHVPFGQLWRTGANEPTTLITTAPLEVAGIVIPAGRTALYTIPGPESWELILNAATSQWGIESEYSAKVRAQELGRAILPSERGNYVERLSFSSEPEARGDSDAMDLVLSWETTRLRIPLRVALR